MNTRFVKIFGVLALAGALLRMAACATTTATQPWWQGKPVSQMTPAERQEQDPEFCSFGGTCTGWANKLIFSGLI